MALVPNLVLILGDCGAPYINRFGVALVGNQREPGFGGESEQNRHGKSQVLEVTQSPVFRRPFADPPRSLGVRVCVCVFLVAFLVVHVAGHRAKGTSGGFWFCLLWPNVQHWDRKGPPFLLA